MKKTAVGIATLLVVSLAHAEGLKPGLWEFSTQTNGKGMPSMPAIPEAQRKQMESMGIKLPQAAPGGGMAMTHRICITPEQAKQGVPPSMERNGEKCEPSDIKTSGNTTSWKMTCSGKRKITGEGTVTHHSDEHISGQTTMHMEHGPAGMTDMTSKFDAKFVTTDCKGAG